MESSILEHVKTAINKHPHSQKKRFSLLARTLPKEQEGDILLIGGWEGEIASVLVQQAAKSGKNLLVIDPWEDAEVYQEFCEKACLFTRNLLIFRGVSYSKYAIDNIISRPLSLVVINKPLAQSRIRDDIVNCSHASLVVVRYLQGSSAVKYAFDVGCILGNFDRSLVPEGFGEGYLWKKTAK